jgi:c-di-GMP-related signal transduction protein
VDLSGRAPALPPRRCCGFLQTGALLPMGSRQIPRAQRRQAVTQELVHVGRQPIFDVNHQVLGYELLFRTGPSAQGAEFDDATLATSQVIVSTFAQFGVRSLVGPGLAFVNVTRPFLTGELPLPFDPDRVVLEILEDTEPDEQVLAGCRRLVDAGFRLALDDLAPDDPRLALLEVASYGKLDLESTRAEDLSAVAEACRDAGVELVAEKVETEADMEAGWVLGCTLFQGRYLARAQVLGAPSLTPGRLSCLRLLGLLSQPDVSFEDVEDLVRLEPALAVRVLTVANSAAVGARRESVSVRDALVMLGLRQLRGWLQLMLFADLADSSSELFAQALVRARACELLAGASAGVSTDTAFTTGLVSSLDVLLGQPIEWIAARMGLGHDLHFALTAGSGPLGELLDAVRRYEEGVEADGYGEYDSADLARAFLAGVEWSRRGELTAVAGESQAHFASH